MLICFNSFQGLHILMFQYGISNFALVLRIIKTKLEMTDENKSVSIPDEIISNKIYLIRDQKVMPG